MRSIRLRVPLVFMLLILLPTAALAVGPLRLPPDDPPPALAALLALDGLDRSVAITLSDDGALAAGAFAHPKKSKSSLVRALTGVQLEL